MPLDSANLFLWLEGFAGEKILAASGDRCKSHAKRMVLHFPVVVLEGSTQRSGKKDIHGHILNLLLQTAKYIPVIQPIKLSLWFVML